MHLALPWFVLWRNALPLELAAASLSRILVTSFDHPSISGFPGVSFFYSHRGSYSFIIRYCLKAAILEVEK